MDLAARNQSNISEIELGNTDRQIQKSPASALALMLDICFQAYAPDVVVSCAFEWCHWH